jgi:hypothetical protein
MGGLRGNARRAQLAFSEMFVEQRVPSSGQLVDRPINGTARTSQTYDAGTAIAGMLFPNIKKQPVQSV